MNSNNITIDKLESLKNDQILDYENYKSQIINLNKIQNKCFCNGKYTYQNYKNHINGNKHLKFINKTISLNYHNNR